LIVHPFDPRDVVERHRLRHGRLDTEGAAAEQPVEHGVAELHAGNTRHRNVDTGPFDHTFAAHQPFRSDDEMVVPQRTSGGSTNQSSNNNPSTPVAIQAILRQGCSRPSASTASHPPPPSTTSSTITGPISILACGWLCTSTCSPSLSSSSG